MTTSPTKAAADARTITEANRRFYDEIASTYEGIDPRRKTGNTHAWLDRVLAGIAERLAQGNGRELSFLDAGAGTGFLVDRARAKFPRRIAVDVSENMLAELRDPAVEKICASLSEIPIPAATIDCVGSFATLHHLFAPEEFFQEAHRMLRPGGILYTDHDIAAEFVARFAGPLKLYRALCDHGKRYLAACPHAHPEDYHLSEFHGDRGLSGAKLRDSLLAMGFRAVELTYHWEGMGPFALAERILPESLRRRPGWSPIVRILAIK